MAAAMIYDTLKLAEQLEHDAGFDSARAKAMARILAANAGGNLATREDLLATKAELQTAIHSVRSELASVRLELGSAIGCVSSELNGKIAGARGDIRVLCWMTGTTLAGVATLLGIAITVALHVMHLE